MTATRGTSRRDRIELPQTFFAVAIQISHCHYVPIIRLKKPHVPKVIGFTPSPPVAHFELHDVTPDGSRVQRRGLAGAA